MTTRFIIESLTAQHHRRDFSCDVAALDSYFHHHVSQDVRRRVTACYVATELQTQRIAGFYTLSASSVPLVEIPESLTKRLPHYPTVPVARLGRLAIHKEYRGQKLGAALLWDALSRVARSEIAVFALVVDAKDTDAQAFYRHHGFVAFGSVPLQLILPLTQSMTLT